MSAGNSRSLPKFGEWDVNNPASAEGFTVIFSKARDEKKSNGAPAKEGYASGQIAPKPQQEFKGAPMKRWWCCF